jgi:hypothetical protein
MVIINGIPIQVNTVNHIYFFCCQPAYSRTTNGLLISVTFHFFNNPYLICRYAGNPHIKYMGIRIIVQILKIGISNEVFKE